MKCYIYAVNEYDFSYLLLCFSSSQYLQTQSCKGFHRTPCLGETVRYNHLKASNNEAQIAGAVTGDTSASNTIQPSSHIQMIRAYFGKSQQFSSLYFLRLASPHMQQQFKIKNIKKFSDLSIRYSSFIHCEWSIVCIWHTFHIYVQQVKTKKWWYGIFISKKFLEKLGNQELSLIKKEVNRNWILHYFHFIFEFCIIFISYFQMFPDLPPTEYWKKTTTSKTLTCIVWQEIWTHCRLCN